MHKNLLQGTSGVPIVSRSDSEDQTRSTRSSGTGLNRRFSLHCSSRGHKSRSSIRQTGGRKKKTYERNVDVSFTSLPPRDFLNLYTGILELRWDGTSGPTRGGPGWRGLERGSPVSLKSRVSTEMGLWKFLRDTKVLQVNV